MRKANRAKASVLQQLKHPTPKQQQNVIDISVKLLLTAVEV